MGSIDVWKGEIIHQLKLRIKEVLTFGMFWAGLMKDMVISE
jgi:hypothetical protein